MKLISVVVPIYKVEPFLSKCVQSIQRQTHSNLEIILVDDGSPDLCPQLCDAFAQEDYRIKVIHKTNQGLGFARNTGIDEANGEYIAFVDADDWISETHLESLYQKAEACGADVVIGAHTKAFKNGKLYPCPVHLPEKLYFGEAVMQEIVLPLIGPEVGYPKDVQLEASACMNLYRLPAIRDNGVRFVNEKQVASEDLLFNIALMAQSERVVVHNALGYYYFENTNSLSRTYQANRIIRTRCFYEEIQNIIKKMDLSERVGFRADRTYLLKVRTTIKSIALSSMERKNKLVEIEKILKDDVTQQTLQNYPIGSAPLRSRWLLKIMRDGSSRAVLRAVMLLENVKRLLRSCTWKKE